jgi:hypothetical protein
MARCTNVPVLAWISKISLRPLVLSKLGLVPSIFERVVRTILSRAGDGRFRKRLTIIMMS